MTGEILLPTPHSGQQKVLRSLKRFNFVSAGRRWRKTTMGMALATERAARGQRIGWGAPTYDQVRIGWNETKKACGNSVRFIKQEMTATFPSGGYIFFRSLDDPDNARGHSADGWIFDEIGDIKPTAYYDVVYAMLIEDPTNWFLGIGTPKGRNWFWREWLIAQRAEDSTAFQIPTIGCEIVNSTLIRKPHLLENPHFLFTEAEKMYDRVPEETFRQEMLAEFLEHSGVVFRKVVLEDKSKYSPLQQKPHEHKGHDLYFGVDWGKQNDFTVITCVCSTCRQMVLFDRFNQIDYAFQRKRLEAHIDRWKPVGVLPERNSMGEPIIEELQRAGINVLRGHDGKPGFYTSPANKTDLIESLAVAIEKGDISIMNQPILVSELLAYERSKTPAGNFKYGAPEGLHDDTVISLALAWNAIGKGGFTLLTG